MAGMPQDRRPFPQAGERLLENWKIFWVLSWQLIFSAGTDRHLRYRGGKHLVRRSGST